MSVPTCKTLYRKHAYSGPRKSFKRVRGGLRQFHDVESRAKVWRVENVKMKPNKLEQTVGCLSRDSAHTTQDAQHLPSLSIYEDKPKIRTYSRKPKISCETTACSTTSIPIESVIEPETIDINNWPQPDPDIEIYQLTDDSSGLSGNQIHLPSLSTSRDTPKVFCPKCGTEVEHTAESIQEDQTKILIAKVYHYFEQEYEELKKMYGDLDLTNLSKFRQRTALATGVSETTVLQILEAEEGRNAEKRQEPPEKPRRARKRSRQTDSSSEEDSSDDNVDDNEPSSSRHDFSEEPEIYVVAAVKVEPRDVEVDKEQPLADPIALEVETEPRSDVVDNANETLTLNEPAGTKRKARKIPRSDVTSTRANETLTLNEPAGPKRKARKIPISDVTSTRANETLTLNEPAGTKSKARKIPRSDVTSTRSSLFGYTERHAEDIEIYEGIS